MASAIHPIREQNMNTNTPTKTFLCDSGPITPKPQRGYAIWIEWGKWYTARKVNPKKFGPHRYDGWDRHTGNCSCGCYMGRHDSSGPVDPFGACPNNPLT